MNKAELKTYKNVQKNKDYNLIDSNGGITQNALNVDVRH